MSQQLPPKVKHVTFAPKGAPSKHAHGKHMAVKQAKAPASAAAASSSSAGASSVPAMIPTHLLTPPPPGFGPHGPFAHYVAQKGGGHGGAPDPDPDGGGHPPLGGLNTPHGGFPAGPLAPIAPPGTIAWRNSWRLLPEEIREVQRQFPEYYVVSGHGDHPHVVSALCRNLSEDIVWRWIARHRARLAHAGRDEATHAVLDVGCGNAMVRHAAARRAYAFGLQPLLSAADVDRQFALNSNFQSGGDFCLSTVEECLGIVPPSALAPPPHAHHWVGAQPPRPGNPGPSAGPVVPGTAVFNHSLYYFTPVQVARVLARLTWQHAYAIVHEFREPTGFAYPFRAQADGSTEYEWNVSGEGVLAMSVRGNSCAYVHPSCDWLRQGTTLNLEDGPDTYHLVWTRMPVSWHNMAAYRLQLIPQAVPNDRPKVLTCEDLVADVNYYGALIPGPAGTAPGQATLANLINPPAAAALPTSFRIDVMPIYSYGPFLLIGTPNKQTYPVPKVVLYELTAYAARCGRSSTDWANIKTKAYDMLRRAAFPPRHLPQAGLVVSAMAMEVTVELETSLLRRLAGQEPAWRAMQELRSGFGSNRWTLKLWGWRLAYLCAFGMAALGVGASWYYRRQVVSGVVRAVRDAGRASLDWPTVRAGLRDVVQAVVEGHGRAFPSLYLHDPETPAPNADRPLTLVSTARGFLADWASLADYLVNRTMVAVAGPVPVPTGAFSEACRMLSGVFGDADFVSFPDFVASVRGGPRAYLEMCVFSSVFEELTKRCVAWVGSGRPPEGPPVWAKAVSGAAFGCLEAALKGASPSASLVHVVFHAGTSALPFAAGAWVHHAWNVGVLLRSWAVVGGMMKSGMLGRDETGWVNCAEKAAIHVHPSGTALTVGPSRLMALAPGRAILFVGGVLAAAAAGYAWWHWRARRVTYRPGSPPVDGAAPIIGSVTARPDVRHGPWPGAEYYRLMRATVQPAERFVVWKGPAFWLPMTTSHQPLAPLSVTAKVEVPVVSERGRIGQFLAAGACAVHSIPIVFASTQHNQVIAIVNRQCAANPRELRAVKSDGTDPTSIARWNPATQQRDRALGYEDHDPEEVARLRAFAAHGQVRAVIFPGFGDSRGGAKDDSVVHVDRESWLKRFPLSTRRLFEEARTAYARDDAYVRYGAVFDGCFSKQELLLKSHSLGLEETAPRAIQSQPPSQNALVGPGVFAFQCTLAQVWDGRSGPAFFATGATADLLGARLREMYERVGGELAHCAESDGERFDATQNRGMMALEADIIGPTLRGEALAVYMRKNATGTRGRSNRGIRFRVEARESSGKTTTLLGNTIRVVLASCYDACRRAGLIRRADFVFMRRDRRTGDPTFLYHPQPERLAAILDLLTNHYTVAAGGDDEAEFVSATLMRAWQAHAAQSGRTVAEDVYALREDLGHRIIWQEHQHFGSVGFYSSFPLPVATKPGISADTWILSPMLGRVLAKVGYFATAEQAFSHANPEKLAALVRGDLLSRRQYYHPIPVLGAYVETQMAQLGPGPSIRTPESYRRLTVSRMYYCTTETVTAVCHRYDIVVDQLLEMEAAVRALPAGPCAYYAPALRPLFERDVGLPTLA